MDKSILLRNAHTSSMAAAAALATAIGAATTAMAVDYPVMSSQGYTSNMGESFFDRAINWTNSTLNISVPPNDPAAANYDYELTQRLRSPSTGKINGGTLNVFHSHKFTSGNGSATTSVSIYEAVVSGTVTNRFENEGLVFIKNGGISPGPSRYGDVTYEGIITVMPSGNSSSYAPTVSAGDVSGTKASVVRLAGTLHGTGRFKAGTTGLGAHVVIEADASGFTGILNPNGATGWVNFGCEVFNGEVAPWNGAAIGTERATSVQLNKLTINSAGSPLIVHFSESAGRTGTITVTNAFSQAGTITVQLRGDLPPPGKYPVLRLASGCIGDFDRSQITFGGFVTDLRAARTVSSKYAETALVFATEGDGSRVVYVDVPELATVLYMR